MIFIFSGIFLRQIDESNLRSIASERVDDSIVQFLGEFLEEFKNDPKGAVWKYV